MKREKINKNALVSVLPYWFGNIAQDRPFKMDSIQMQRWYGKSADIDAEIKATYEELHESLREDAEAGLSPLLPFIDQVAAVIVLDQFPRNMYREIPRMYESDTIALQLTRHLVEEPAFFELDLFKQMFVLLPFMHAEDLAAQDFMLTHFRRFPNKTRQESWPNTDFFDNALNFALRHREIIERFGRFPHRNAILARVSTDQEAKFLTEDDSSF